MAPSFEDPVTDSALPADSLLAAIVDSTDDAIISKTLNGIITSWNLAAERMFGYGKKEAIGMSVLKLIPPERYNEESDLLARIRDGKRVEHFETSRLAKNGAILPVSITVSPVLDKHGRVVGASNILRDTTVANANRRADLLLAAIVSSSDDAIISKDLNGIITSWNDGAERIFGYKPQEVVGQSVLKLIPPERHAEEPLILDRLRRGERVDHFETVRVRKTGEHLHVSLTISPVKNAHGEIVGASKIARDITELKRVAAERERFLKEREQLLDAERAARAQAEHANRMKDEFLAMVSHELRTPLNAIVGWTEVLADGGENREDVIHGIKIIQRNATMQAQLIEDLLDLGRISSGKLALDVGPVDLTSVVREAVSSVQHMADVKRIHVKMVLSDAVGGLLGDPKRLQQVVWNLLTNAIKFTPAGGQVLVSLARTASHFRISIADNGAGMTSDFLPLIFQRFQQADSSTTRRHGGLGIGLALVKQLVEMHAGSVNAESPGPGLGSTFTVNLPVAIAKMRPSPSQRGEAVENPEVGDLLGIRVLVVEDDADSLEVIKRILTQRKAEVYSATSAEEALKQFEEKSPDLIVSDIGMPQTDGYELIRRIRELPGGAAVPAAALTAMARADDRTRALNAGFQTHVAKPVSAAELIAVVRSLASLRRRSS
ncbi:MAG: PAS domain S-box protein [Opitutus sp.]